ncbi:MAG TPA: TIM barrel protein, partial [bacterium]|nr:TIM barrel protein [bacterium]
REVFEAARQRGLKLGSVNPTYFLSGFHRGSLISPEEKTRQRAIEQTQIAGRIAAELGQGVLSLWFPDGSLYPGQVELRHAYERMRDGLVESLRDVPPTVTVLLEYKLFEPGTYSTVIPDWGTAFLLARHVGRQAGVLVDLGHHPHGTNIEQIVAVLRSEGLPGGFHFNTRYAADDDQAVEPNPELARIFYELLLEEGSGIFPENWTFMLDQASSRENRIEAILHSIDSLQTALARACLVNRKILHQFQRQDDIIAATRFFNQALLQADVRPVLYQARSSRDLPLDPVMAYKASGYQTRIEARRV